jgi:hypothetical protein
VRRNIFPLKVLAFTKKAKTRHFCRVLSTAKAVAKVCYWQFDDKKTKQARQQAINGGNKNISNILSITRGVFSILG